VRLNIEGVRKILAMVVGTVQTTLGGLAVIFAYFLHIDFFGLQENLNILEEFVPFFMLILMVFGFFSVISGLYLLIERKEAQ
jgi:hypothetical protein